MPATNKAAIDWITRTLAAMGFVCVTTVCVLAYMAMQIPPELNTLTGGLVGSLASMLVKTTPTEQQKQPDEGAPTPVEVVNTPSQPVPTTESP